MYQYTSKLRSYFVPHLSREDSLSLSLPIKETSHQPRTNNNHQLIYSVVLENHLPIAFEERLPNAKVSKYFNIFFLCEFLTFYNKKYITKSSGISSKSVFPIISMAARPQNVYPPCPSIPGSPPIPPS